MKDKLNRLDAILNELQMDEYLNEDSLPKIGEARGLVNNLVKNCSIPVVIESAFIEVFDKAACIHHWHNTGKNDEGMVVSSEKVHELWEVLEKYRDYRHSL